MSAILDFRELRDKVLAGEDDEEPEDPIETPMGLEVKQKSTVAAMCVSAASFAVAAYDRWGNEGRMFEGGLFVAVIAIGGFLPLGYALGNINRGLTAQTEKGRYERLLDEAQTQLEEAQEELDEAEAESEKEKEAEAAQDDYRYDYLSSEDSKHHVPSLGFGIGSFGQEGVAYRPPDNLF
jgi:hypothetical protein